MNSLCRRFVAAFLALILILPARQAFGGPHSAHDRSGQALAGNGEDSTSRSQALREPQEDAAVPALERRLRSSSGLEETEPVKILYKNLSASFEEVLAFSRQHKVRSYKLYRDNNAQDPIIFQLGHPDNPPPPWNTTDLLEYDLLSMLGDWARDTRYYVQITEEPNLIGKIWAEIVPAGSAGLEETVAKSANLLRQVPPALPGSVGDAALVFRDPATFDLAALAVRYGWSVAVPDDSPESDVLKKLLDELPGPKGRYAVGLLESSRFLNGYQRQILIENRPEGFKILGLRWDTLPAPVAAALESVLAYLDRAVEA